MLTSALSAAGLAPSFVARGVGGLVGSLGGGALTDRFPGHHVLAASILTMAVALAALASAEGALPLALCFAMFDMGAGGLQAVNALVAWTNPQNAASYLNTLNGCFGASPAE